MRLAAFPLRAALMGRRAAPREPVPWRGAREGKWARQDRLP